MKHQPSEVLSYIRDLYAKEDSVLQSIREAFEARGLDIQVGAEEGKLLQLLLKLQGAKHVVEVGTLGGYSAIWMARALPDDGHVHTIEHDAEHAELARRFIAQSDVKNKITLWEGKAETVLPRIAETVRAVDAVFIDADKINYPTYLAWAEAHLKPGGLVIGDNTLLFGTVHLPKVPEGGNPRPGTHQAMRAFNARLADSKHFDSVMIPTEQGLTVGIRKKNTIS
ncbi:MAG: O-methyltransferase [Rickettsiales bacterium]